MPWNEIYGGGIRGSPTQSPHNPDNVMQRLRHSARFTTWLCPFVAHSKPAGDIAELNPPELVARARSSWDRLRFIFLWNIFSRLSNAPTESLRLRRARATERIHARFSRHARISLAFASSAISRSRSRFTCVAFPWVQPRIAATDKPTYKYPRQLCIPAISRRLIRRERKRGW